MTYQTSVRKKKPTAEKKSKMRLSGTVTRSMTAACRHFASTPRKPDASRQLNAVDQRYTMILNNMVGTEAVEKQLISAINENKTISIPNVEVLDDADYHGLYDIIYTEMPRNLIKEQNNVHLRRSNRNGKLPAGLKKFVTIGLPPAAVSLEKLDFSKWRKECSRFKINKTDANYYHVSPYRNAERKVLRIRK